MIDTNFNHFIEEAIKNAWHKKALSNYKHSKVVDAITYEGLAKEILGFHYFFKKSGIKKGDKVVLLGRNSVNWAIIYLSVVSYGAVIVPVLPDFHVEDITHIVNHSDALLLFVADDIYERLDEGKFHHLNAIFSLDSFDILYHKKSNLPKIQDAANKYRKEELSALTASHFRFPEIDNAELAAILYTSGTTGFSKGVMLSHNCIIANLLFAEKELYQTYDQEKTRMLSFLPLAHAYSCAFEFLMQISFGVHVTFISQLPSPSILLRAFQDVKPWLILAVPLIVEKVYRKRIAPRLKKPLMKFLLKLPFIEGLIYKKIREGLIEAFGGAFFELVIGAAPLNEEVEQFFKKIKFPFTVGYGMTENGPLISYADYRVWKKRSVGKIIFCLEAKIDSEDPYNIDGEVMVKGENVMMGYYKNKDATNEVLDKEGWLRTGDLGVFDKEGFLYLKGRKKDMILGPSGENIYPETIESKLDNLPFVLESVVIEREGKLIALVCPDMEEVDAAGIKSSELEMWLAEKMEENRRVLNHLTPSFVSIKRIKIQAEPFEKTPTKKIKRFLYK